MSNDPTLLYNLEISNTNFDQLLEIIEEFDVTNDIMLMKLIKKSFPMDYNLDNLSSEFIKELSIANDVKIVYGSNHDSIKIWDIYTGQIISKHVLNKCMFRYI